jgi:hypothetical protein
MGIDRRYSRDPELAIRSGNFFNCIRGAAEPEEFQFSAQSGSQSFPTGSNAPAKSVLHVAVKSENQAIRLVLKKDGTEIREAISDHMDLVNAPAGVYRVEAYLLHHPLLRADVPWIISNPIFVGVVRDSQRPPGNSQTARALLPKHVELYKR